MVKYEYRVGKYVGDFSVLVFAILLLCVALLIAFYAEQQHKEAYELTIDCWVNREQYVNPWIMQDNESTIDKWSSEVDINVSFGYGKEDS